MTPDLCGFTLFLKDRASKMLLILFDHLELLLLIKQVVVLIALI